MAKLKQKAVPLMTGRPPLSGTTAARGSRLSGSKKSSKVTRKIIRSHHNLHKQRAQALERGDDTLLAKIDTQIEQLGGLQAYQNASLTGQSKDRGGDSSILLVSWLEELALVGKTRLGRDIPPLRVLEIGALSSSNAISSMLGKGVHSVRRIDLKSQEPDQIEEIDFMALPVPARDENKFDLISLSLVVNYVPTAGQRGQMLERISLFFRKSMQKSDALPCLFFVLPLPCVTNSRYMTADRLRAIMDSLGYQTLRTHQSAKLHYELFHYVKPASTNTLFKKLEVNPGKGRNNFAITLEPS